MTVHFATFSNITTNSGHGGRSTFKRTIRDQCGIPLGIGHSLHNALEHEFDRDLQPRNCCEVAESIHNAMDRLKQQKMMLIQSVFLEHKMDSESFLSRFLKDDRLDSDSVYFLRNALSLKTEQIQTVVPLMKTAAKMVMDSKGNKKSGSNGDGAMLRRQPSKYSVNTKKNRERKSAITPFNVWLPRNVLYSKQRLMTQQKAVRSYFVRKDWSSSTLKDISKKQFVRNLNMECGIGTGPLYELFDNLPIDLGPRYTATMMADFVCDFLDEIRRNNVQRANGRIAVVLNVEFS